MTISPELMKLVLAIRKAGGTPLLVGGCVRDHLMWRTPKDYDLEVYGLHPETLAQVCMLNAVTVNAVGKSFGVLKVTLTSGGEAVDVSTPRTESKVGRGHRGFMVTPSPNMSPRDAAGRRDFTVNALAMDPITKEVLDFYGGREDLKNGFLRATTGAYVEDPLRVLRGMKFASRFNMYMDDHTAALSLTMREEYSSLPVERIWEEWKGWSLGRFPSMGLKLLDHTNWLALDAYDPLWSMGKTPQDKEWHPEGNVWKHTLYTVDAAALIAIREKLSDEDRSVLVFAALCHDMGKVDTTFVENITGRVTSPGHAESGVLFAGSFLQKIGAPEQWQKRVLSLVGEHMWAASSTVTARTVRRLSHRLATQGNTILDLDRLVEADRSGRPPLMGGRSETMGVAVAMAEVMKLEAQGPTPIMLGRHLIEMGYTPGPIFKSILDWCWEQQLDGSLTSVEIGKELISDRVW